MIRRLTGSDRTAALEALRATGSFNDSELDIARELVDTVIDQPDQQDYHAFVDVPDNPPATVRGILILGPTPATTGTWDLYWIASHPAHQGTGTGQALDAFAAAFVRSQGGYLIIAETSSQDSYARARRFYVKQGYAELARIADYYRLGDDLVVYGRRL